MHRPLTLVCLIILEVVLALPQQSGNADQDKESTQGISHYTKLSNEEVRHLQEDRGFGSTVLTFKPTTPSYDDDEDDNSPSPSQSVQARTSSYDEDSNYLIRNAIPVVQQRPQIVKQPQPGRKSPNFPQLYREQLEEEAKQLALEEKEMEEPDRLSLLLPQSKFDCIGKNTGYYADDGLGCEVFHYCQNNAKHSWICPEGFTFHQVHLICMPPGQDNICEQSSQYHFINEYLYKPLNLEEHQNKPNISLRYSDRYYPDQYNYQRDYNEEDEETPRQHKQPVRVAIPQVPRIVPNQRRPVPTPFAATYRPETTIGQVFRSPEEVNISLQQRRPAYLTQRYLANEDY